MRTPKTTSPTGNGARGGACVRGPQPGGRRACRPVPGWVVQAQPPCPALWSVAQTQGPSLLLGLRVSLAEDIGASGAASFFDDGSLADLGQSRLHPGVASQAGCLLHVVTLTCRPHGAVVAPLRAGRREGPGGRGAACAGGAAHHPDVGLGSGPSWGALPQPRGWRLAGCAALPGSGARGRPLCPGWPGGAHRPGGEGAQAAVCSPRSPARAHRRLQPWSWRPWVGFLGSLGQSSMTWAASNRRPHRLEVGSLEAGGGGSFPAQGPGSASPAISASSLSGGSLTLRLSP